MLIVAIEIQTLLCVLGSLHINEFRSLVIINHTSILSYVSIAYLNVSLWFLDHLGLKSVIKEALYILMKSVNLFVQALFLFSNLSVKIVFSLLQLLSLFIHIYSILIIKFLYP